MAAVLQHTLACSACPTFALHLCCMQEQVQALQPGHVRAAARPHPAHPHRQQAARTQVSSVPPSLQHCKVLLMVFSWV